MIWIIETSYGDYEYPGLSVNTDKCAEMLAEEVFEADGHGMHIKKAYFYDDNDNEVVAPPIVLRELEKMIEGQVEYMRENAQDKLSMRAEHGTWGM